MIFVFVATLSISGDDFSHKASLFSVIKDKPRKGESRIQASDEVAIELLYLISKNIF